MKNFLLVPFLCVLLAGCGVFQKDVEQKDESGEDVDSVQNVNMLEEIFSHALENENIGTITPSDIPGWNQYVNDGLSCKVNFPAEWIVDESTSSILQLHSENLQHTEWVSEGGMLSVSFKKSNGATYEDYPTIAQFAMGGPIISHEIISIGNKLFLKEVWEGTAFQGNLPENEQVVQTNILVLYIDGEKEILFGLITGGEEEERAHIISIFDEIVKQFASLNERK